MFGGKWKCLLISSLQSLLINFYNLSCQLSPSMIFTRIGTGCCKEMCADCWCVQLKSSVCRQWRFLTSLLTHHHHYTSSLLRESGDPPSFLIEYLENRRIVLNVFHETSLIRFSSQPAVLHLLNILFTYCVGKCIRQTCRNPLLCVKSLLLMMIVQST